MQTEIGSTVTIALPGRTMYPESECDGSPVNKTKATRITLDSDNSSVKVVTRRCKPCFLRVNVSTAALPKDRSYTALLQMCIDLAQSYGGIAVSCTFPWEGNSKYKCGEELKIKKRIGDIAFD